MRPTHQPIEQVTGAFPERKAAGTGGGGRLTIHLHLVLRSRTRKIYLHAHIHLHGVVLRHGGNFTFNASHVSEFGALGPQLLKHFYSD